MTSILVVTVLVIVAVSIVAASRRQREIGPYGRPGLRLRGVQPRASTDAAPPERRNALSDFEVVGESFHEENLRALHGEATEDYAASSWTATLILEDDNPHDSNAVRVDIDGRTVGHLSRADAVRFRNACGPGTRFECPATIGALSAQQKRAGSFGVRLG